MDPHKVQTDCDQNSLKKFVYPGTDTSQSIKMSKFSKFIFVICHLISWKICYLSSLKENVE